MIKRKSRKRCFEQDRHVKTIRSRQEKFRMHGITTGRLMENLLLSLKNECYEDALIQANQLCREMRKQDKHLDKIIYSTEYFLLKYEYF